MSHLYAEMFPEKAGWDKRNLLLAALIDEARWLHWAKTVGASEGVPPPDPIPRPGYLPRKRREGSKPKKPMRLDETAKASLAKQAGRDGVEENPADKAAKLHALFRQQS